jgi:hypothetical protein
MDSKLHRIGEWASYPPLAFRATLLKATALLLAPE